MARSDRPSKDCKKQSYKRKSCKCNKEKCEKEECFSHTFTLQLCDGNGFLVNGSTGSTGTTQCKVKASLKVDDDVVTLSLPHICFQSGPISDQDPATPPPGGYLYTVDGFLPKKYCPADLDFKSVVAASDVGMNPLAGQTIPKSYIILLSNAGGLIVQAAGEDSNRVPVGPQTVLPTTLVYKIDKAKILCKNYTVSTGQTDITAFTGSSRNNGIRDSHVIDLFNGVAVLSWTDNSSQVNQANNVLDCLVSIGSVSSSGHLSMGSPINLTNFVGPSIMAWTTAAAIDRRNPNNIVVSYGHQTRAPHPSTSVPFVAVLNKIGGVWTVVQNGPLTGLSSANCRYGDCNGVRCDQYGNFWYNYTNRKFDPTTPATLAVSIDGGLNWAPYYTTPSGKPGNFYDYPQFVFGGGPDPNTGQNTYGLWMNVNYVPASGAYVPVRVFIAIYGHNNFATGAVTPQNTSFLTLIQGIQDEPVLAASLDGNVWAYSQSLAGTRPIIGPLQNLFKSPGVIDVNYAGPFDVGMYNSQPYSFGTNQPISYPGGFGYFFETDGILYDNIRKVLYAIVPTSYPELNSTNTEQDMRLSLVISGNNGLSWSNPIVINTTDFANRGFIAMALDPVVPNNCKGGNLLFGWYDGRNDPSYKKIEYMAAVLPAAKLDCLVANIPLSDTVYSLPSVGTGPVPPFLLAEPTENVENVGNVEKKSLGVRRLNPGVAEDDDSE